MCSSILYLYIMEDENVHVFCLQQNHERNPIEEMMQAEEAGHFVYIPSQGESTTGDEPTEQQTQQDVPVTLPSVSHCLGCISRYGVFRP